MLLKPLAYIFILINITPKQMISDENLNKIENAFIKKIDSLLLKENNFRLKKVNFQSNLNKQSAKTISMAKKLNSFTLKLFRKLSVLKEFTNIFFSPYSLLMITEMVYFGARTETSKQLKKLLDLSGISNDDLLKLNKEQIIDLNYNDDLAKISVKIANKFYYDEESEIKKDYIDLLRTYFLNEPTSFNFNDTFRLIDEINKWVAGQTNQKINYLLDYDTKFDKNNLFMVNAIYFSGEWKMGFDSNKTTKEKFYVSDNKEELVDMMKLYEKPFYFIESPGGLLANAYHLKYKDDKILMTILLPYMGISLNDIEKSLNTSLINGIIDTEGLQVIDDISLPKFKLEFQKDLSQEFKELGANLLFDSGRSDLTGITEQKPFHASQLLHKAVIEINENGTEAAASSVFISRDLVYPNFHCNRPFLFLIHDRRNVLFIGRINNPNKLI